jgi:hypothetical protein
VISDSIQEREDTNFKNSVQMVTGCVQTSD